MLNICICNISITAGRRVKRTSPSFSALKTEWKTITKTSFYKVAIIGKSGETEKTIHLFLFLIFAIFLGGPRTLGIHTMNISLSQVFERAMWHFNLSFKIVQKIRGNGENHTLVYLFDFCYFFRRPPQFGDKYHEYQFFTGFRRSYVSV